MHIKMQKWFGLGAYLGAVFLVSAVVLGSFFQVGINGYPPALFRDMVDGTAHKPFVYRALAPLLIRTVERAIPSPLQELIHRASSSDPLAELFERYGWAQKDAVAYAVTAGFLYLCLLLFVHAFGVLARTQYEWPVGWMRILSLMALAGLPCFFRYYSYLYDFLHLALFCYALSAMYSKKWVAYGILFVLACLSKETAILLPFVYALYYKNEGHTLSFRISVLLQLLIFALVKLGLFYAFKPNPGSTLEFHVGHNLTLPPYGFGAFGTFIAMVSLCAWHWDKKPIFLRSAVWMLLPLLALAFWFGLLDEYRDYYEVYPVVVLLAAPAIFFNRK